MLRLGCASCVDTVNKALRSLDGIHRANTSLEDSSVEIEYDDSLISFDGIKSTIENTGHDVV